MMPRRPQSVPFGPGGPGASEFAFRSSPHPSYIEVFGAGLQLRFATSLPRKHSDFVHAVRCNKPVPSFWCNVFYFEILVVESGQTGAISIGLSDETADLQHQPGIDENSFGYRGLDGKVFTGSKSGRDYGPDFGIDDVVGCGISFITNEVFFTHNGRYLGPAATVLAVPKLYATISLSSPGEIVHVNFGYKDSFRYDIATHEKRELHNQAAIIKKTPVEASILPDLVRSFLRVHGYSNTLQAFESAFDSKSAVNDDKSLVPRQAVIQAVCAEEIDDAASLLQQHFPGALRSKLIQCDLNILRFIKLVRDREVPEAIMFAQNDLSPFADLEEVQDRLQNALALLVNPEGSPQAHLLTNAFREEVAMRVNKILLEFIGSAADCKLTLMLRQLIAVEQAYRNENSQMGLPYQIENDI